MTEPVLYTEDNIRSLEWQEHIRLRPGMYIGKLGDGSSADDGITFSLKKLLTIRLTNSSWAVAKP